MSFGFGGGGGGAFGGFGATATPAPAFGQPAAGAFGAASTSAFGAPAQVCPLVPRCISFSWRSTENSLAPRDSTISPPGSDKPNPSNDSPHLLPRRALSAHTLAARVSSRRHLVDLGSRLRRPLGQRVLLLLGLRQPQLLGQRHSSRSSQPLEGASGEAVRLVSARQVHTVRIHTTRLVFTHGEGKNRDEERGLFLPPSSPRVISLQRRTTVRAHSSPDSSMHRVHKNRTTSRDGVRRRCTICACIWCRCSFGRRLWWLWGFCCSCLWTGVFGFGVWRDGTACRWWIRGIWGWCI